MLIVYNTIPYFEYVICRYTAINTYVTDVPLVSCTGNTDTWALTIICNEAKVSVFPGHSSTTDNLYLMLCDIFLYKLL